MDFLACVEVSVSWFAPSLVAGCLRTGLGAPLSFLLPCGMCLC